MKKIKPLLLAILFITASKATFARSYPGPAYVLNGPTYTSNYYHVSISFPAVYTEKAVEGDTETIQISSDFNNDLYYIGLTKHTIPLDEPEELAKVSLSAFVEELEGELLNESLFAYEKHKGIQAVFFIPELNKYFHYKVIIINNIQYQLIFASEKKELPKSARDFFSSFKILP